MYDAITFYEQWPNFVVDFLGKRMKWIMWSVNGLHCVETEVCVVQDFWQQLWT